MADPRPCPRCGGPFVCEADAAMPAACPCFGVRLTDAARAALRAGYRTCVCVACLQAVQAEVDRRAGAAAGSVMPGDGPARPEPPPAPPDAPPPP